jgi:hypothetical protein
MYSTVITVPAVLYSTVITVPAVLYSTVITVPAVLYSTVITVPAVLYKCKHLPLKLRGRKQIEGDREQSTEKNVWI